MNVFLKKLSIGVGLMTALFAASEQANAATYSYTLEGGRGFTINNVGTASNQSNTDGVLTIDTATGLGTVIGAAMNVAFSGDFSSFTGGAAPQGMFNITISPTSTLTYQGNDYNVAAAHQPMLKLMGNSINLWAVWKSPTCAKCLPLGDTVKNITSSSSGGTAVPEPGMLGLFGLGAAAVVFGRRRKGKANVKTKLVMS